MGEPSANSGLAADHDSEPAAFVHVMGRLRVIDHHGVQHIPLGSTVRTLLLFVALSGTSVHIEHAIDVLWPDLPVDLGKARLRNVLARLHAQCGPVIQREGSTLVLRATTDLAAYSHAVATLITHAGQEIAPDARYADWAETARRRLETAAERLAALL